MAERYAQNNLGAYTPPECPRCHKPASFTWVEVEQTPVTMLMPGRHWCDTPGCVDEDGYNTIFPRLKRKPWVAVSHARWFRWQVQRSDGVFVITHEVFGRRAAERLADIWRAQQAAEAADG